MIHHGLTLYPGSEIFNLLPELVSTLPTNNTANRIVRYSGDASNPQGLYFYNAISSQWERIIGNASIASMFSSNGSVPMTGSLNAGTFAITNVGSPIAATDAANKAYVDNSIATGNSATATKLQTPRTISATGDATYTTTFDGSANVTANLTLSNSGAVAGTYTKLTVDAKGRVTSGTALLASDVTTALGYTPLNRAGDTLTGALILNTDPVNALGAVTKQYVDAMAQGFNTKPSAKAATTANIVLSGVQSIDGVSLVANDICLVKNQTTPSQNGLYVVQAGAWTRQVSTDTWAKLVSAYLWVQQGTLNADSAWTCVVDDGGTLNTTPIVWTQFSGAGQIVAGTGIVKAGNTLSLDVSGAVAGTYTKLTVDALGRVTVGSQMANADIVASLGYAPLNRAGDTLLGAINANNQAITNVPNPTVATGAANKAYVDGKRFQYTSGTPSVSHTITHNLGFQYCDCVCIDPATNLQFSPSNIQFISAVQAIVTLSVSMNIVCIFNV
jgi:phage-related tail fiber protein